MSDIKAVFFDFDWTLFDHKTKSFNAKSIKASAIFGDENCDSILHISTMDIAKHTCEICGAEFEDASTHADICKQCAEETDRCEFCGKKLTEEMKQQRQNLLNQ